LTVGHNTILDSTQLNGKANKHCTLFRLSIRLQFLIILQNITGSLKDEVVGHEENKQLNLKFYVK